MSLITVCNYSTKGIKRLSSAERNSITIPDEIKDILVGILLGDALLRFIFVKILVLYKYLSSICLLGFYIFHVNFASLKVVYNDPTTEKALILK